MSELLNALLFSLESDLGRRKQDYLATRRLLCSRFPGIEPPYRVSWETIEHYRCAMKGMIVQDMEACQVGSELGGVFSAMQSSDPLDELAKYTTEAVIPSIIRGWSPSNGYDMDAFVDATDPFEHDIKIRVEIFPRAVRGQVSPAFASALEFEVPLSIYKNEDGPADALGVLIAAERIEAGQDVIADVAPVWAAYRGCWYHEQKRTIGFFLGRVATSVIDGFSTDPRRVVLPMTAKRTTGEFAEADLHVTTSRR